MGDQDQPKGVFYGWWVLLVCLILHALGAGTFFYGFSVFYSPIILEFGWSKALTAGAFSLSRLEGGLEGPFIGWLVDRYGSKKLLLLGVIVTGIGYLAMTRVDSVLLLYLVYGGLLSFGFNTGLTHSLTSTITHWFIQKRSRALSLYALGSGVGGSLLVPLIAYLVSGFGWRTAAIICGLIYLVVGPPLALLIKNKPEDIGLLPDGIDWSVVKRDGLKGSTSISEDLGLEVKFTTREAVKSKAFWTFALAQVFRSFLLGSIVLHQIPYLTSIGVAEATAATVLGMMIAISIPGRLVFGTLGDYYSKQKLLFIVMATQALGIFIFSKATGLLYAYVFVVVYGFAYGGAVPLQHALTGELFGRTRYATISGLLAPIRMVGSIIGPIFAGYVYDVYHSYSLAFQVFTLLALLSSVSYFFVKPEKPRYTI